MSTLPSRRKVLVCDPCRRKKRKCDRCLPCSTCTRSGLLHFCAYENAPPLSIGSTHATVINQDNGHHRVSDLQGYQHLTSKSRDHELNLGLLPQVDSTIHHGKFNLHRALHTNADGVYKVLLLGGIFSVYTLASGDPASLLLREYIQRPERTLMLVSSAYANKSQLAKEKIELLDQQSISIFGPQFIKRLTRGSSLEELVHTRQVISGYGGCFGINYVEDANWRSGMLGDQIRTILPPVNLIIYLVNAYFANCYFGSVMLVEEESKRDFERILGITFSALKSADIVLRLKNSQDLLIVARLLYVLRLSFLAELEPASTPSHCVSIDAAELAERIVMTYGAAQRATRAAFECHYLRFIYRFCAPEMDGFGISSDIGPDFCIVVLLAKAIGMNRDASNKISWSRQGAFSPSEIHEQRRMWSVLQLLDLQVSSIYGVDRQIRTTDHDVSLPSLETPHHADKYHDLRKAIHACNDIMVLLDSLSIMAFPAGAFADLEAVLSLADVLHESSRRVLGEADDYFHSEETVQNFAAKKYKFKVLLLVKTMLTGLYYALYVYYHTEKNSTESLRHLRKLIQIGLKDLSCIQLPILSKIDTFFGKGAFLEIATTLMACNTFQVRCLQVKTCFHCTAVAVNNEEHFRHKAAKSIFENLEEIEERMVDFVEVYGKIQRSSWWLSKAYRFGQVTVRRGLDSEAFAPNVPKVALRCSDVDLKRMEKIVTEARDCWRIEGDYLGGISRSESGSLSRILESLQTDRMWQLVGQIKEKLEEHEFARQVNITEEISEPSTYGESWELDMDFLQSLDLPTFEFG